LSIPSFFPLRTLGTANRTIVGLDLSGNDIGDEGAAAVADMLRGVTSLATLALDDNCIASDGLAALAEALIDIGLQHQQQQRPQEDESIMPGAQQLSHFSLVSLSLEENFFSPPGTRVHACTQTLCSCRLWIFVPPAFIRSAISACSNLATEDLPMLLAALRANTQITDLGRRRRAAVTARAFFLSFFLLVVIRFIN
jgi:hypothetical protein